MEILAHSIYGRVIRVEGNWMGENYGINVPNQIIATVWVCVDCMLARENDEPAPTGVEPWKHMPGADVSADWDSETGEGMHAFVNNDCDACGTAIYGELYRYAVWSFND